MNEERKMAEIYICVSIENQAMLISMVNTHRSNDISSICYAILEELSKTDNYPIKKCQNCGMYFIANSRLLVLTYIKTICYKEYINIKLKRNFYGTLKTK